MPFRVDSDSTAFYKVENDGFGLGVQRRAIEKNDLPQVQSEVEAYLQALRTGQFRANGPTLSQPGATPQENAVHLEKGLKARPNRVAADGSGFQPSDSFGKHEPGALPQAGIGRSFGAEFTNGLIVQKEKITCHSGLAQIQLNFSKQISAYGALP